MAHFVELDEKNVVLRGIVVSNADTADVSGAEKEEIGGAGASGKVIIRYKV